MDCSVGLLVVGSELDGVAVLGLTVAKVLLGLISDAGFSVELYTTAILGVELNRSSDVCSVGLLVVGSELDGVAVLGLTIAKVMLGLISDAGFSVGLYTTAILGVELGIAIEGCSVGLLVVGSELDGVMVVGKTVGVIDRISLGLIVGTSVGIELEGFALGSAVGLLLGRANG